MPVTETVRPPARPDTTLLAAAALQVAAIADVESFIDVERCREIVRPDFEGRPWTPGERETIDALTLELLEELAAIGAREAHEQAEATR